MSCVILESNIWLTICICNVPFLAYLAILPISIVPFPSLYEEKGKFLPYGKVTK
jgi:hypothetical protein